MSLKLQNEYWEKISDGNTYVDFNSHELRGVTGGLSFAGTLTLTTAVSKIVPGATSLSLRNNADSADNIIITDAGAVTFRGAVSGITTLGMTGALSGLTTIVASGLITSAGYRSSGAAHFGFGSGEAVTIVSGVATVTKPYVILDAEGAGTTDTLDSITYSGQAAGDILILTVNATDTITADNSATLLLGAATRAIAPGGCLILLATSATIWVELAFLTAAS